MRVVFIGAVQFSRSALERPIDIQTDIGGFCNLQESSIRADHSDLSSSCEDSIPRTYTGDVMGIYQSELGVFPFPRSVEAIPSPSHLARCTSGFMAAEAFQLLREWQ